uniref:Uncharacterized protein n=1 Tax=Ditylum brightwellii TaxID=49249 RepID=A0A6S9C4Z6_9STRA
MNYLSPRGFAGNIPSFRAKSRTSLNRSPFTLSGTDARPLGSKSATSSSTVTFVIPPRDLMDSFARSFISSRQPHSISFARKTCFKCSFSPVSSSLRINSSLAASSFFLQSGRACWA